MVQREEATVMVAVNKWVAGVASAVAAAGALAVGAMVWTSRTDIAAMNVQLQSIAGDVGRITTSVDQIRDSMWTQSQQANFQSHIEARLDRLEDRLRDLEKK